MMFDLLQRLFLNPDDLDDLVAGYSQMVNTASRRRFKILKMNKSCVKHNSWLRHNVHPK